MDFQAPMDPMILWWISTASQALIAAMAEELRDRLCSCPEK